MGQIFRLKEDDENVHVSTGKFPYPGGQEHPAQFEGKWLHEDMGYYTRWCAFPECDVQEYHKGKPE